MNYFQCLFFDSFLIVNLKVIFDSLDIKTIELYSIWSVIKKI